MKSKSVQDVTEQSQSVARGSLRRMVGCLRGVTWFIRLVLMCEFTIRMIVSMTMGQYGDAAWEIAVVIALCPAWDETANDQAQRLPPGTVVACKPNSPINPKQ
jgi:hypothetical protein